MKIQLIRNATLKITYAGQTLLIDPMLVDKNAIDPFAGIARNPTVELPLPAVDVISGVNGMIVSHLHPDHFDQPAHEALPKAMPVFCQPGEDAAIAAAGFRNVQAINESQVWEGITITRTGGKHGRGEILKMLGEVSGFVLQASDEPTVYWVGDSIWCPEVAAAIEKFNPDIIVTHSGAATLPGHDAIIMDGEQTLTTAQAAPNATVVAIHLESLDHCALTREQLRQQANAADVSPARLLIPQDGETVEF